MHRLIRDHLEAILTGSTDREIDEHLEGCENCRAQVAEMRQHSRLLKLLRGEEVDPAPGFYARVTERVEAERRSSIWSLFLEPVLGRRIAYASLALALLIGAYLVSSEQDIYTGDGVAQVADVEDQPTAVMAMDPQPDPDAVLVSLATYREQ